MKTEWLGGVQAGCWLGTGHPIGTRGGLLSGGGPRMLRSTRLLTLSTAWLLAAEHAADAPHQELRSSQYEPGAPTPAVALYPTMSMAWLSASAGTHEQGKLLGLPAGHDMVVCRHTDRGAGQAVGPAGWSGAGCMQGCLQGACVIVLVRVHAARSRPGRRAPDFSHVAAHCPGW